MTATTPSLATILAPTPAATGSLRADAPGAVTGTPRRWLRLEGLAAFAAGVAVFLGTGAPWILLLPLLLAVDVSMAGYLAGPRVGAFTYNLAHNWGTGIVVLALGLAAAAPVLVAAGGILVAHTGMDRVAGYGLKYPSAFADTHLGRLGGLAR